MSRAIHSLLPLTPDTMRHFPQEIVIDVAALLRDTTHKEIAARMPELSNEGREMSFMAAFEALRMFRHLAEDQATRLSDTDQSQLAEVEVEWCLDILDRLHRDGKLDE